MITISPLSDINPYILAALDRLMKQLKRGVSTSIFTEGDITECCENGNCTIFVAEDSTLCGSQKYVGISVVFFQRVLSHWLGEIHDVVVDKQYRGSGIGTLLMEEMIKEARTLARKHARGVRLSLTSAPRRNTHSFYTNLGFKCVTPTHEKNETNLYRMVVMPVG